MSKKTLTDDLILSKMAEGRGVVPPDDIETEDKYRKIQEHYEFTIDSGYKMRYDVQFYTETTADGYEVWIATEDEKNPYVGEDIYYYDNDWLEKMPDAMISGHNIYYDIDFDDYSFQEVIDEVYEDYFNDIKEEVENELIEEGYEYEQSN
jgi:curved DNA-binding protein CbpA